ncbi:6875_t:CDS:2, partial [Racocetra fulgida]
SCLNRHNTDKFLTTNTLNCIFHIVQNISLNLKNHLKDNYDDFIKDFFEWLYANKESWAKAFVLKLFIAGMLSISRVESYNAKIKRLIFNLIQLSCVLEEDKKTEYALFCTSVPKAALVAAADSILPNVCKLLRKYLTIEMLKIQEDQIKQSLQYHATIVVQEELQRFLTVNQIYLMLQINLDDSALYGENLTDIIAKSMLDLINTDKVVE